MRHPALDADLATLLDGLSSGRWTALDLVEAHLARIEAVDGPLNAVVALRADEARAEAREADRRRASGETAPLLGVPCTVKEFLAVEGAPHTAGLVAREGVRARTDAVAVARVRAAGAIVLGLTNGPEGGLWAETVNPLYGRTRNPWDRTRTSGGSSGGEGAIIAAGGSPFGLGSDIGGSVRIPAALCGVVGHKPSARLVPTAGHHPPAHNDFLTVGPLARRVDDCVRLLPILAGPHPDDPIAEAVPLANPPRTDPARLQVLVAEEGLRASTPAVRRGLIRSAEALIAAGARVDRISVPELDQAFGIWLASMASAGYPTYAEVLGDGRPIPVFSELLRAASGSRRHTLPPLLVAAAETLARRLPVLDHVALHEARKRLADRLTPMLEPDAVLLVPTSPRTAPRHGGMLRHVTDGGWCGVFNVLGLPATTVPTGFDPHGLPTAAQCVAAHGRDDRALTAAGAIEAALGGWVPAEVA